MFQPFFDHLHKVYGLYAEIQFTVYEVLRTFWILVTIVTNFFTKI